MTISESIASDRPNGTADIQARLAEINKRVSPIFEEHVRLTEAVNKAITLIFTMAAIGILTVIAIAPTEQSLKERDLITQESRHG